MRTWLMGLSVVTATLLTNADRTAWAGEMMYWTDFDAGRIYRAALDGANIEIAVPNAGGPRGIAFDLCAEKVYWVDDGSAQAIRRANMDGSQVETVVAASHGIGLAIDGTAGKLYWCQSDGAIRRANLDGSATGMVLTTGAVNLYDVALDTEDEKLYWTSSPREIGRADMTGANPVYDLVPTSHASGLALDWEAGKIYWTDVLGCRIQRANLDGSGVENVVSGLNQPVGITVHEGKVYWADYGAHKIQCANLDGSGLSTLVDTGSGLPQLIAVTPEPTVLALMAVGGLALIRRRRA